jgi:hypothetical protein
MSKKKKIEFFQAGGDKFLNGDKPDQDTFQDLVDSVTFPKEVNDTAKRIESGLAKTTTDLKVNTKTDTDDISAGHVTFVKPSQLWRLTTSDAQITLTPTTRNSPDNPATANSENGSAIEDIDIAITVTHPAATVTATGSGLTLVGTRVELGGTLSGAITLAGASNPFTINALTNFSAIGTGTGLIDFDTAINNVTADFSVDSTNTIIDTSALLKLKTAAVTATSATVNDILTLINATTGQCEWTTPPATLTDNIYTANGTVAASRTVTGGGNSLEYVGFANFDIVQTGKLTLGSGSATEIEIRANTVTVNGSASKLCLLTSIAGTAGFVLKLVDPATGQCTWQAETVGTLHLALSDQTLNANRTINGVSKTHDLTFEEIDVFTIDNTSTINLEGAATTIRGISSLTIKTPAYAASAADSILVQSAAGSGIVEYKKRKYAVTSLVAAWVGTTLTISASTHLMGTTPFVQVFNDGTGVQELPGSGLTSITVNGSGDVAIVRGSAVDVRVVII